MNVCLQLFTVVLFLFSISVQGQEVVINEIMASNKNSLQDLDGEMYDWIELYNRSDDMINLSNYSLSDDNDELKKWIIPNVEINPKSFLIIFASNKDIRIGEELHTNFKISADGESLFLSNHLNEIIDQTDAVTLSDDEVYQRIIDGASDWGKSYIATPGYANIWSNELIFNYGAGFFEVPINEKIWSSKGDTVFYTMDGSLPTSNSNVYSDSIPLSYRYNDDNVFAEIPTSADQSEISYHAWDKLSHRIEKSNILRCASFRNGVRTSKVYTNTYFIDSNIVERFDIPVVSLVTSQENLFDNDIGILVPGNSFDQNNPEWTGNFFNKGRAWERPVHLEYFENNGTLRLSQDAGIRIHGGKTRQAVQKSLRLYARATYGEKHFNHQLLPQKNNSKYKRFILRTTMGSWGDETIIKDELAHEMARGLDIDFQDYAPVVLFVNGEYWGIHTLRDRVDEHFISYSHGIDKDSVALGRWGDGHYINFENYIKTHDLAIQDHYDYVETQIDVNNLIDYSILEMFLGNLDWPSNNLELWRPIADNGKWRWILFDVDAGFIDYNYNMLLHASSLDFKAKLPQLDFAVLLWNSLFKNEVFVNRFLDRYEELLTIWFTRDKNIERINHLKSLYINELDHHIARWNYPLSVNKWEEEIEDNLFIYLENRPCAVEKHLKALFESYEVNYNCERDDKLQEEIVLYPNPTNGNIFLMNNGLGLRFGEVVVINQLGQIVYIQDIEYFDDNEHVKINVDVLPTGFYYLVFKDKNRVLNKKFTIVD